MNYIRKTYFKFVKKAHFNKKKSSPSKYLPRAIWAHRSRLNLSSQLFNGLLIVHKRYQSNPQLGNLLKFIAYI